MKKLLFVCIVLFCALLVDARAPLESYKRYMIVLVHGTGANTLKPHDYTADPEKYEDDDAPRKSAIWDRSQDDMGFAGLKNWQGNIGGNLQNRGFLGHVVWYDFYEPWKSPIYDSERPGFEESLSRYLGDRNIKESDEESDGLRDDEINSDKKDSEKRALLKNPMSYKSYDFWKIASENYRFEGVDFFSTENAARIYCQSYCKTFDGNMCSPSAKNECLNNIKKETQYFGRTAQSYWLHEFFPKIFEDKVLDENDLVTYKGNNISYLELAQKDWELWYKIRNSTKNVNENEKPKKYILVAHSMGGLTTRDYITGGFYKGDVDKLITLDSPHEGSAIANYVQYWHKANNSALEYVGLLLPPLAMAAFLIANQYGIEVTLPDWLLVSTMPLLEEMLRHSIGNVVTDKVLSEYSDAGMKYGIDVMALNDDNAYGLYRSDTKDFLKRFNQRNKLDDDYNNGYEIPYVRLVSTSGVPTPGGSGFHKGMIYPVTSQISNLFDSMLKTAFRDENGSFPAPMAAICLKWITGMFLNSLWNDWGSGFVPHWSSVAKNVALFNNPQSDAKRWNVAFDYSSINNDAAVAAALEALYLSFIGGEVAMHLCPWDNIGFKLLRYASYVAVSFFMIKNYLETFDDIVNFVGFHGGMARRVDEDKASDAPTGRGSDKKMIDELLWEKPSVSIVYKPINEWDYSKGGYVGLGTTKELFEYENSTDFATHDVKWKGETSAHEFNIDLSKKTDKNEQNPIDTIYIAGKYAKSKIKSITLKRKKENEDDLEIVKQVSVSECIDGVKSEENTGAVWTVSADNEGLLKCATGVTESGIYTMQVEVAHDGEKGGFLVDIGREPGRAFVPGELLKAKDNDWDKYITFKNRRPQKKAKVEKGIPEEKDLDRTVADMVDYHRSPLLVVNQLPRVFELEVDDLQPDRMNKLKIDFNFGTASITYEANNDPNKYSNVPAGFEDKPAGLVDPSQEKFTVTVVQGGETKKDTINNPIDAWGKMVVDLDELEKIFGGESIQPFLEGRNHLRIVSENRWQMSRIQDMNIFIPGPPPTVTPIYPMADDAFCRGDEGTELKFETDLIYGQSSELVEGDLDVSYSSNGTTTKIEGFKIEKKTASNTKYTVTSKNKIKWPKGEFSITVIVKPRINNSAANSITYQFSVKSDCVEPTVVFDETQEIYNPPLALFSVYDQDAENGPLLSVEDVLVEMRPAKKAGEKECDESENDSKSVLLFAENFAAPGAKVRNLTWRDDNGNPKYPDGRYRLVVSAHDNTIKDNESDAKKKNFWKTYGSKGELEPNLNLNDFPKSRNPCNKIEKMTQWKSEEKEIVLDFTKPTIGTPQFSISADNDGKIVYAGETLKKDLTLSATATDALSDEAHPVKAMLTLAPLDNLGKPLEAINYFDMSVSLNKSGEFELKHTILAATDDEVKSMIETMQLIPDGIYAQKLVVKDPAGNTSEKDLPLLVIDETAPVIKNVHALGYAETGKKRTISFEVSEENDVGMLVNLDMVKIQVVDVCGEQTLSYTYKNGSVSKGFLEYETSIPQGISGSCKTVIEAEDAHGNKRKSEWAYVVDYVPPQITSPTSTKKDGENGVSAAEGISGNIAIYGFADDPYLPSGGDFVMYELSYAPVDANSNVIGTWKSLGMSVPESQRCANFVYRSCKPVSQYSANSVLGYWNTNMIPDDKDDDTDGLDQTYRIRVVAYDQENSREAYVDVFVAAKQKVAPTIAFDNLPSEMNFETTGTYDIDWNTTLPLTQNSGLVRLEIMRLNDNNEKMVSVVNRTFENIVPNAYYGEPQGTLGMGAYLWISKNGKMESQNTYHLKLVAGNKETTFNVSFFTRNSASLNIKLANTGSTDGFLIDPNKTSSMGTIGTLQKTLSAKTSAEYVIETDSKQGLYWNLASSTLKYDDSKFENLDFIPFYVKGHSTEEFAFVGSEKVAIGSLTQSNVNEIHIPSMIGGRNFVWDGAIDGSVANVPTGTYRFKVTLEGLDDNQSASDEKIVKITGKSISLTNVKVEPKNVDFSNELPKISFHFNINQDALVSVYVRSKNGAVPTDLNEFMKLRLDGQDLLLKKQLLAGRKADYIVNWDGTYGKSSQIKPNHDEKQNESGGYEFVIEVYDLNGNLVKTETADFKLTSMMQKDDNIVISIDGNSTKKVKHGGEDYLVASGMNDAVLEFAPEGTRVVTDVVPVKIGYKGKQYVQSYPYERYSVGVQIHKRSIEYWAVVAVKYRYLYETEGSCKERTYTASRIGYKSLSFSEDDGVVPKVLEFNFHNQRGSDQNGKMDYVNAHLLLIPKASLPVWTLITTIYKIDQTIASGGKETWDKDDQENWNELVKYASAQFKWFKNDEDAVFSKGSCCKVNCDVNSIDADDGCLYDDLGSFFASLKSSGRQSRESWVNDDNKTPPYYNSTQIAWDKRCDVGIKAVPSVCEEDKDVEDTSDDPTRANGIYDDGEPTRYSGEPFDSTKHNPEIEVVAWAWKNTSGENKRYSSDDFGSCLGSDDADARSHLMLIFKINPTERFWSNPNNIGKDGKAWVDYGWNNDVNRYLTLDPMNENFLFGSNGAFKDDIEAPYVNPISTPVVFNLSDSKQGSLVLMNLLQNKNFVVYNDKTSGGTNIKFQGMLLDDVELFLHNFKINPSLRKYHPAKFNVDLAIGDDIYSVDFGEDEVYSGPFSLGGLKSDADFALAIGMDESIKPPYGSPLPWPLSNQNIVPYNDKYFCQPKKGVCGASPDDVLFDISNVKLEENVQDGYKVYEIPVTMGRMLDGSSGFDLNEYLQQSSDKSFYHKQGPNSNYNLFDGNDDDIIIQDAHIFDPIGDYYIDRQTNTLRKNGCENGCKYDPYKDPLMAQINDDDDGRGAGEDGKDANGVSVDDDGDLAVDEDPANAVRIKLQDLQFPFIGGGSQKSYIERNLADLLENKADEQNVNPGNSDEKGEWSVLKKENGTWSDNEIMLTKWENSNNPASFTRTALFYKDGQKHSDVEIVSASGMNDYDATKAKVRIAPAKFDGRDRRLLEVKAKMDWKDSDTYEIYASSDKGWINLTPNPLGKLSSQKMGTIAYWDVKTSGYHQLLLIRNSGGTKYYKVLPVAVSALANDNNTVFADALGRSQVSTDAKVDYIDVVPLGKGEIPQTIPADAGRGPVVQIYPALTELKSATLNLRFSKDEVSGQGWNNATIYVVSEGMSPQPLQGINWRFYHIDGDGDEEVVGATLTSKNWDYAIATGFLSVSENSKSGNSVQAPLGENVIIDSDGSSVSVKEKEAGTYEIDFNVTSTSTEVE